MTDPYRLTPDPRRSADRAEPGAPGTSVVRALLWLLLVVSAAGNMAASFGDASTSVHAACGAVTAACVIALVVPRVRGRR